MLRPYETNGAANPAPLIHAISTNAGRVFGDTDCPTTACHSYRIESTFVLDLSKEGNGSAVPTEYGDSYITFFQEGFR